MRQLFITIALAAIMAILAAVGCAAQDNVASAYNKFSQCVDGEFTTMSKVINYRDIDSGEIIGECEVKQFKLPAGKGNYIKNLTRAMAHDSDNAYHSASGKAGNKGVTYAIAYGTGKNDFELIGADNDMDFMVVCFKDKLHSDNRISYAVEPHGPEQPKKIKECVSTTGDAGRTAGKWHGFESSHSGKR